MEANGGGHGGNVLDKGQGIVAGLGGGDSEIKLGVGFDLQTVSYTPPHIARESSGSPCGLS
jgi:hypothetical protein